tara:strand:+ start:76 stop:444 length:369 start_codon:yes stop_codon:yes gene_type:complete
VIAKIISISKKSINGYEGIPSEKILIALPTPIPVIKIVKLHNAGNLKDEFNAPIIQKIAIVIYRPIIALKIFAKSFVLISISFKKGKGTMLNEGWAPYEIPRGIKPKATKIKKIDSLFINLL